MGVLLHNKKQKTLASLESYLDELETGYVEEIQAYKEKLESSKKQIDNLSKELHEVKASVINLDNDQSNWRNEVEMLQDILFENEDYNLIENYLLNYQRNFQSNWSNKMVEVITRLMHKKYYEGSSYFINFMSKHKKLIDHETSVNLLYELGQAVFVEMVDFDHFEYENNFINIFQLFRSLHTSIYATEVKRFLVNNFNTINYQVYYSNSPEAIIEMIKCFFAYELKELLPILFNDLLEECPFIIHDFTEEHLGYLLIASVSLNKDKELVKQLEDSDIKLGTDNACTQLYNLYSKLLSKGEPSISELNMLNSLKGQLSMVPPIEKSYMDDQLKTVELKVASKVCRSQSKTKQDEVMVQSLSMLPNNMKVHPDNHNHFKTTQIKVGLYKHKSSLKVHHFYETNVKKAEGDDEFYITKQQLKVLAKIKGEYWIELWEVDKQLKRWEKKRLKLTAPRQAVPSKTQIETHTWKWPTTDVNEKTVTSNEAAELNDKSALRQLGYQITGMNRKKRWDILTSKAVPQLGIKRVAYTISFLIKGRKAMKNGSIKYQNSISEWEHDLNKLKSKYFRNDFNWPGTS